MSTKDSIVGKLLHASWYSMMNNNTLVVPQQQETPITLHLIRNTKGFMNRSVGMELDHNIVTIAYSMLAYPYRKPLLP